MENGKWKIILIFLLVPLFACDKSSFAKAYKEYFNAKVKYEETHSQKYLKSIVECGKFLGFDVRKYERLLITPSTPTLKTNHKKTKKVSKYIQIYSFNPLKVKIPYSFKFYDRGKTKYFDVEYGIIPKQIIKKFKNITLKIAQFNKKTVRIVFLSKKNFTLKYSFKNHILTIHFYHKISNKKLSYTPFLPYKPKNKIIVIDPGHGGRDAGGVGIGRRMEKIAVLKIAKYLAQELRKRGYKVYLTRKGDYFISLKYRTHFANKKKADLFISIHCNIAPHHHTRAKGIETYFLSPTRSERAIRVAKIENKEIKGLNYLDQRVILGFLNRDRIIDSNKLAIDIQAGMLTTLRKKFRGVVDGGVRPAPFWVLVGTQMPAILIEAGYLTNPTEAKRLFNPTYQKLLAKGIAQGIDSYFRKNP